MSLQNYKTYCPHAFTYYQRNTDEVYLKDDDVIKNGLSSVESNRAYFTNSN